jgi:thiamine-monophosphate kinase
MNNAMPMKGEDRFIESLRAIVPAAEPVLIGIGDDAAVLRRSPSDTAATADLLVEGIDFLAGETPERIGRRAVSVNLSDLAAVGATPRWFLLSLALPETLGPDFALALSQAAAARGREFGACLAGGDLSRGPAVFVSVAMCGDLESAPLTRSGARPGDWLYVSGATGRAAAGLRIARAESEGAADVAKLEPHERAELLEAYRDPEPRVELGRNLSREGLAHAAIDVSDGLGVDAGRLSRASGLRIVVEADLLPVAPALAAFCRGRSVSARELVLGGGDDYELLFAAPPEARAALDRLSATVPLTRIGFFEEGSGAVLRTPDGDRDIGDAGYDHFGEPARP